MPPNISRPGTGLGNDDQEKGGDGPVNACRLAFWAGVKIFDIEVCAGVAELGCLKLDG